MQCSLFCPRYKLGPCLKPKDTPHFKWSGHVLWNFYFSRACRGKLRRGEGPTGSTLGAIIQRWKGRHRQVDVISSKFVDDDVVIGRERTSAILEHPRWRSRRNIVRKSRWHNPTQNDGTMNDDTILFDWFWKKPDHTSWRHRRRWIVDRRSFNNNTTCAFERK